MEVKDKPAEARTEIDPHNQLILAEDFWLQNHEVNRERQAKTLQYCNPRKGICTI